MAQRPCFRSEIQPLLPFIQMWKQDRELRRQRFHYVHSNGHTTIIVSPESYV